MPKTIKPLRILQRIQSDGPLALNHRIISLLQLHVGGDSPWRFQHPPQFKGGSSITIPQIQHFMGRIKLHQMVGLLTQLGLPHEHSFPLMWTQSWGVCLPYTIFGAKLTLWARLATQYVSTKSHLNGKGNASST